MRVIRSILGCQLLVASVVACGPNDARSAEGTDVKDAVAAASDDAASEARENPCTVLDPSEVVSVIGALRGTPWRAGATCHYEANDGQRLDIDVQFTDARALGAVMGVVDSAVTRKLVVRGAGGPDTLEGRWDEAHWQLGNSLLARSGDAGVVVYMANTARPDPSAAARLADAALGRIGSPLTAIAIGRAEPTPLVTAGNPCALISAEEVTALAGRPVAAPVPEDDTYCRWSLEPRDGRSRDFSYSVTWKDGFAEFNTKVGAMALYREKLETPALAGATDGRGAQAVLGELMKDTVASKLLGAFKGAVKRRGVEIDDGSLMPANDPDVPGPWSRGALLMGEELLIVQKGVCVRARISGVGYETGKALMAVIAKRL